MLVTACTFLLGLLPRCDEDGRVRPGQALPIKPLGLDMEVLLATETTGGAISVISACYKPGEGPPDHVHFNQEEMFFIVGAIRGFLFAFDSSGCRAIFARPKCWRRNAAGPERIVRRPR